MEKSKSSRNKTIELTDDEISRLSEKLITLKNNATVKELTNKTINQDIFDAIQYLPDSFVDLLFVDPPYNMNKQFRSKNLKKWTTKRMKTGFVPG